MKTTQVTVTIDGNMNRLVRDAQMTDAEIERLIAAVHKYLDRVDERREKQAAKLREKLRSLTGGA